MSHTHAPSSDEFAISASGEVEIDQLAGKPDWYHQSTNPGTANQLSWYRA